MDYSKMSDRQIDEAVEDIIRPGWRNSDFCVARSYCNSWADAGPIIQLNRIMLNPYCADELWKAEHPVSDDRFMKTYAVSYDKNPLLAAMIVYLMMHDKGEE